MPNRYCRANCPHCQTPMDLSPADTGGEPDEVIPAARVCEECGYEEQAEPDDEEYEA